MKYKSRRLMPQPYTYERKEGEMKITTVVNGYDVYTEVWVPPRRSYAWNIHIPWGEDSDELLEQYSEVTKAERIAVKEHIAEVAEREGL